MCVLTFLNKKTYSLDTVKKVIHSPTDIDATGVFYKLDNKIDYLKSPVNGEQFYELYKEMLPEKCDWMIIHNRDATSGSHYDNKNNHPFIHDNAIGAHVGIIYQYESNKHLFDLKSDTDSEIAVAVINSYLCHRDFDILCKDMNKIAFSGQLMFCDIDIQVPMLFERNIDYNFSLKVLKEPCSTSLYFAMVLEELCAEL